MSKETSFIKSILDKVITGGDTYKYYQSMNELAKRNNQKPKVVRRTKIKDIKDYIPTIL